MKKLLLLIFMLPMALHAQYSDDFADGDFIANPAWHGDSAEYKISIYTNAAWSVKPRLQLNGVVADTSYLMFATPMANLNDTEWDFWARLAFNTSKSNNARVYLVSDNSNLESALNGYFVMFGDDNDDQLDSISLWKQTGSGVQKLIAGHIGFTGTSHNYRIKVTRDNAGLWSLYSDTLGQNNFQLEGTATDVTFNSSAYFGVFCKYTSTNKTNFYFDDIYAGPQIVDTVPPALVSIDVISQNQVDVHFTENLETSSAQNTSNYSVNGIGNPTSAVKDIIDASLVHLIFATPFISETLYTITVQNVSDISLNAMSSGSLQFAWYNPKPFDIVINEIMADPDPPVGLPNYEYIELYNRTPVPIPLKNWSLQIGTSAKVFPEVTIQANGFMILASETAEPALAVFGDFAGFSSFSLTNTGTSVTLLNSSDEIIHSVNFTDNWYNDPTKADGGWSIEQIDPENPCGDIFNWKASVSVIGGTPGSQNSVFASNPDTVQPAIMNLSAVNSNSLQLTFSEIVLPGTLTSTTNYTVDNGIGSPVAAVTGADSKSVTLQFANSFDATTIYTLTFTDTVEDCAGNYITTVNKTFSLYQPKQFEIEINEIMADPEPLVGLPDYEYLELYNRTSYPISLRKWSLVMGTSMKTLPDVSIDPHGYLILCGTGASAAFAAYGKAAEISGLSLTNDGTSLLLLDTLHRMISSVTYSSSWYRNSFKADGGWSLEQIDPSNPCGEGANWTASTDASGGTPGKMNSVNASNPDTKIPELVRASVSRLELSKVRLFFSEPADSTTLKDPLQYSIDNSIGSPLSVKLIPPDYRSVILNLPSPLQYNIIYHATITDSIRDCAGNLMPLQSSVRFAVPELPDSGDLVINEVLSNPKDDGVDYVEIYNRSGSVFDLSELYLASYDSVAQQIISMSNISPEGYLIFPQEYAAVTVDPEKVKQQYFTPNPNGFAPIPSMPSYNNDDGSVVLCTVTQKIIDMMKYDATMQYPLLNSTEGVSLERVDFNRPASDRTNWHSAAESVGFGTPAYINSQYSEAAGDDGAVTLSPEIFSPDNDGYNDVLNISYKFDEPGFTANIIIFDANGRPQRKLVQNELLGTSGVITWDGITDDNEKANTGIYIVYFEAFDTKGDVKRYKRSAVLATKFK